MSSRDDFSDYDFDIPPIPKRRRWWHWAGEAVAIVVILLIAGCVAVFGALLQTGVVG